MSTEEFIIDSKIAKAMSEIISKHCSNCKEIIRLNFHVVDCVCGLCGKTIAVKK